MQIPIVAELLDSGIEFEATSEDFVKTKCVFHEDKSPSATLSTSTGRFQCFACNKVTSFEGFLAASFKTPPGVVRKHLEKKYGASNDKTIDIAKIELWHARLFLEESAHLLGELHKRAVSDKSIRQARIGVDNNALTIPIFNENNYVVNVRRYRPGAAKNKFSNTRGHGSPIRLYPIDQLRFTKIVLCGGEVKALAAAAVLNLEGIGAIATTGGEGNWPPQLSSSFRDKTVFVIYDVDGAGQVGALKVCTLLYRQAREVRTIQLPLDVDKHPHGDMNDFLMEGGDLPRLLLESERKSRWLPAINAFDEVANAEPEDVSLNSAIHARKAGKRIRTVCVVSAVAGQPYSIPKACKVTCDRSQQGCSICPVFMQPEDELYDIAKEHSAILALIDVPKKQMSDGFKDALGIPQICRVCSFEAIGYYHVEEAMLSPQLEISDRAVSRETAMAYVIADENEIVLNECYTMEGRMHPHPQTQANTLLISTNKTTQDALSLFKLEEADDLLVFQPDGWAAEPLRAKLNEVYTDLEANVTNIYQRRFMHLAMDLSFHSPLNIHFQNRTQKGWVETLILGDSAQGKTETAVQLMRHYKLGEKVDCKNATSAGILGGLQQIGKRWYVQWGIIPTHDRRLVVLEELKGLSPEVIGKLTDMRSSGIAELPKIEKRRTHARTRLIALSNPRSSKPMSTYPYGVEAIRELLGSPEDVRRFDLVAIVAANEVSAKTINKLQLKHMDVPRVFTGEICRKLVLWAWTVPNVVYEDERHLIENAIALCEEYSEDIPLVDSGSMRNKLARLSAALACRTFSHKGYNTCFVRKCHTEYICAYLKRMYDTKAFGYNAFSASRQDDRKRLNVAEIKLVINHTPRPETLVANLLNVSGFDHQDLQDWTGLDRDMVQAFVTRLCGFSAIKRMGQTYHAAGKFIDLLKDMTEVKDFGNRPEYFNDEEF